MDVRRTTRRGSVAGGPGADVRRARRDGRLRLVAALAALALLVAGCGSTTRILSSVGGSVGGSTVVGGGAVGAPIAAPPGDVTEPAYGPGTEQAAPAASAAPGPAALGSVDDAKIVKTGTLTLEVAKLDDALAAARTAIAGLGGYVSGTDESNDGDRTRATILYRIPAARWDDALDRLRALATKVVAEQTNAVEVTGQILDLDARIRNLQATESALQGIMAKAIKISDVLEVQTQLTSVQGEIEQLTTQKAHLEDQAALGTLSVSFAVPVPAVTTTREGWDAAAEVDRAVASLVALAQGLTSFAIWFSIVALPVLAMLAVLLGLAWLVVRRFGVTRRGSGFLPPDAPTAGTPPAAAAPEA